MSDIARASPGPPFPRGPSATVAPNPLRQLPAELVEPAGRFVAFWSESLKGNTALVARLLWWINEEGLTHAEAKEAMRRLMTPEQAAKLEYSGKVLAALAEIVEMLLKDRRKKEAMERRKVADEADKNNAAHPSVLKAALSRIGDPR